MVFAFAGDSTITRFFAISKFAFLLGATSVFSVSLWLKTHHRDKENTEIAQRALTAVSQNIYQAALSPTLEFPKRAVRPSAPKSGAYSYQKANQRAPDCPVSTT